MENGGRKEEILNYRPVVFCAAAAALGIFLCSFLYDVFLALAIVFTLALCAAAVFFFFKKKTPSLILFFFAAGLILYFISYTTTLVSEDKKYSTLSGTVTEIYAGEEGYKYAYRLDGIKVNGEKSYRNAYLFCDTEMQTGYQAYAKGELTAFNYDPRDSYTFTFYNDNVNYIMLSSDCTGTYGKAPFYLAVYGKIRNIYLNAMGKDAGGFALALMFGDTSQLSEELTDDVRVSGMSHIFSVSGLHVAFAAAALAYLLKLLKINRAFNLSLVTLFLLFYGLLAGFPASMVRAGLMLLILLAAEIFSKRYDPLSALALSALVIFFVRPLSLFELGFQMSFAAMLGIICFYRPLRRFLYKGNSKILSFAASSFSMSLSANAFLVAVSFNTFRYFGIYFCLSNLILIPYISVIFYALTVCTVIVLVIPVAAPILVPVKYLILGATNTFGFLSSLPYAYVKTDKPGPVTFIYAAGLMVVSRFVMVSDKTRYASLTVLTALGVMAAVVF